MASRDWVTGLKLRLLARHSVVLDSRVNELWRNYLQVHTHDYRLQVCTSMIRHGSMKADIYVARTPKPVKADIGRENLKVASHGLEVMMMEISVAG